MLDDQYKLTLLEINSWPGFHQNCEQIPDVCKLSMDFARRTFLIVEEVCFVFPVEDCARACVISTLARGSLNSVHVRVRKLSPRFTRVRPFPPLI